jgi:hypothetical protein
VLGRCCLYCGVNCVLTVQGSREASLYVLDCLFSVLIVGTLVVFVWRGAWTILDLYLYPQHADCSAWTSMVSTSRHSKQWIASVQRMDAGMGYQAITIISFRGWCFMCDFDFREFAVYNVEGIQTFWQPLQLTSSELLHLWGVGGGSSYTNSAQ